KTVQSFSVKRSLDFLCVGIAYRCDRVRIYQSAFQIVCVFLEFKLVRSKEIIGQPCDILNRFPIPDSLEFQVMYREYRLDAPVELICLETFLQVYRNQAGLPVMAVDQVRPEIHGGKDGQRRL